MLTLWGILSSAGEQITGGEGECPAINTNQATERSNSTDRRAILRKTMKGKPITGSLAKAVDPSGKITWAPAIFELFGWSARMMSYRLHDLYRDKQLEWWEMDIKELRLLKFAFDIDADTIWTEELLLKKLGLPAGKRIYITGRGNLLNPNEDDADCFAGMHIKVSKASKVAITKFSRCGATLEAEKKCGKWPQDMRDPELVEAQRLKKKQKIDQDVEEGLERDGIPISYQLTPMRCGPVHTTYTATHEILLDRRRHSCFETRFTHDADGCIALLNRPRGM